MNIQPFNYWHWWIIAAAWLVLELLLPGIFFLWLAIAATIVGFVLIFLPFLRIEYQLLTFALMSVISVVISRHYFNKPPTSDQPFLNQRVTEYIGRTFILTEAIVSGRGRIHLDDGSWSVEGPDCPVGTTVKIIGVNGIRLQIEPINQETQPI